jgi:signal transduction histidine kinase
MRRRTALLDPAAWLAAVHLTLHLPISILATILVALAVTGVSLIPALLIGVPLTLAVLWVTGGPFAAMERVRAEQLLGARVPVEPEPPPGPLPPRRPAVVEALASGPRWRAVGYAALLMLWGPVIGGVVNGMFCFGLAAALLPVYRPLVVDVPGGHDELFYAIPLSTPLLVVVCVLGVLLVLAVPYVSAAVAPVDRQLVATFLRAPRPSALEQRVQTLEVTRERVVDAAEAERRRIERDLHDGAQQRLIAVAMGLGMAREKVDADPETAMKLLDEAHREAKEAISELRDVARGIHPAVLTDRGLDAAMSALAARCPVPVDVQVSIRQRPAASIEAIAYFVVAEALTNVAKHAQANRAEVRAERAGDRLHLQVRDDGVGGADPARGTGLAGLADRVAAVDGTMTVTSPQGGPTVLSVELPCRD